MDQPLLPQGASDHEWWADENHLKEEGHDSAAPPRPAAAGSRRRAPSTGATSRSAVRDHYNNVDDDVDNDGRVLRRSLFVDDEPVTTFGEPSSFPRDDDGGDEFEFGGGESRHGPRRLQNGGGGGGGEGPTTEEEEHRPVLMAFYRCILALGIVVNAVLGVLLMISVVVTLLKERPRYAATSHYIHVLRNSSSSNGEGDDSGDDNWAVWIATMLVLSAAHGLAVIATCTAVVGVANITGGGDYSLAVRNGEVSIVTDSEEDHGDQEGNTCAYLCCCCSCCCIGGDSSSRVRGRQRQLCGSCASACLSVVLSMAYLALSVMAALGRITSNQVGEFLVIVVPDVIKSHLAVSFLIVATFYVVQSRTSFLYRHQIRLLLWSEQCDERSRQRQQTRSRRRRRPWWWQSSSSWEPESHEHVEEQVLPEVSDGWFGFLRRQGRKSTSVPLLSRWGGGNPRDDGSVDFASVQEEWMNRSMEDPHWWSRDDDDWASSSSSSAAAAARSPVPRTKDWDGSIIKRVPP